MFQKHLFSEHLIPLSPSVEFRLFFSLARGGVFGTPVGGVVTPQSIPPRAKPSCLRHVIVSGVAEGLSTRNG